MSTNSWIWLILVIASVVFFSRKRRSNPFPPGPVSAWYRLGDHSHLVSRSDPWKTFAAWAPQYGPIVFLQLGFTPVILINSLKVASDLLEKRGEIYSSRPRNIAGNEILSGGLRGAAMPYGDRWRRWRKVQYMGLNPKVALTYRHFQTLESSVLLRELMIYGWRDGKDLTRFATSVVYSIVYGRRIKSLDDPLIEASRTSSEIFLRAMQVVLVCLHDPNLHAIVGQDNTLLTSFQYYSGYRQRFMQTWRAPLEEQFAIDSKFFLSLFREVKQRMAEGQVHECQCTRVLKGRDSFRSGTKTGKELEDEKDHEFGTELEMAYGVSAAFSAGLDTTMAFLKTFFFAMLLHPEVVAKVHAELDTVIGPDRLPTFADEEQLKYLKAVIKEVHRWRPLGPLGVPHAVTSDDVYEGFWIPKGATVIANIHVIMQDPILFPSPEIFNPDRFLETQNPRLSDFNVPFGFGRRICPGMHVASQSIFVITSRILHAFAISPHPKAGIPGATQFTTSGLVRSPKPFDFILTPRSNNIAKIILEEATDAETELKNWEW